MRGGRERLKEGGKGGKEEMGKEVAIKKGGGEKEGGGEEGV